MCRNTRYDYIDLLNISAGLMFGENNARLPCPALLMFDEISSITAGSAECKGIIAAKLMLTPNKWFFVNTTENPLIMPVSLIVDAMFQLMGVYLCWLGFSGKGRAFGLREMEVYDFINENTRVIYYELKVLKVVKGTIAFCVADGVVSSESGDILRVNRMKVGLVGA